MRISAYTMETSRRLSLSKAKAAMASTGSASNRISRREAQPPPCTKINETHPNLVRGNEGANLQFAPF